MNVSKRLVFCRLAGFYMHDLHILSGVARLFQCKTVIYCCAKCCTALILLCSTTLGTHQTPVCVCVCVTQARHQVGPVAMRAQARLGVAKVSTQQRCQLVAEATSEGSITAECWGKHTLLWSKGKTPSAGCIGPLGHDGGEVPRGGGGGVGGQGAQKSREPGEAGESREP